MNIFVIIYQAGPDTGGKWKSCAPTERGTRAAPGQLSSSPGRAAALQGDMCQQTAGQKCEEKLAVSSWSGQARSSCACVHF